MRKECICRNVLSSNKTMDRNTPILIEAWDETGMLQEESDEDWGEGYKGRTQPWMCDYSSDWQELIKWQMTSRWRQRAPRSGKYLGVHPPRWAAQEEGSKLCGRSHLSDLQLLEMFTATNKNPLFSCCKTWDKRCKSLFPSDTLRSLMGHE